MAPADTSSAGAGFYEELLFFRENCYFLENEK